MKFVAIINGKNCISCFTSFLALSSVCFLNVKILIIVCMNDGIKH